MHFSKFLGRAQRLAGKPVAAGSRRVTWPGSELTAWPGRERTICAGCWLPRATLVALSVIARADDAATVNITTPKYRVIFIMRVWIEPVPPANVERKAVGTMEAAGDLPTGLEPSLTDLDLATAACIDGRLEC